jgi:hypothetical protein
LIDPDHDEVWLPLVEHGSKLVDLWTLANDKAEFFQGCCKKRADVLLAVGDAYGGHDLSPAKHRARSRFPALFFHIAFSLRRRRHH